MDYAALIIAVAYVLNCGVANDGRAPASDVIITLEPVEDVAPIVSVSESKLFDMTKQGNSMHIRVSNEIAAGETVGIRIAESLPSAMDASGRTDNPIYRSGFNVYVRSKGAQPVNGWIPVLGRNRE